jgi:16S rRNA (adenine(1408)-N(1))-methyltransferase
MFLATDANPDGLLELASRATRKPARGGVPNLFCIGEPMDALDGELPGIANRVTAILPWGSLLRGLVTPEPVCLDHLFRLCAPGASVEIVFSYDASRDAGERGPLGAGGLQESHVRQVLPSYYESSGFRVMSVEGLPQADLRQYETNWANRLAFGRRREVWRLTAVREAR